MRAGGPDLLAVDDPVIAVLFSARAQAGDVGAARGLGKQLAPDLFARCERRQITSLLLFAGKRHHGRPAHAMADNEHSAELAERPFLLLPDHAFDRGSAAPAIFLWPVQACPAGVRLLFLPGFRDLKNVRALELGAAKRGFAQLFFILLGRVRRDPGLCLGAERGLLRGVIEIHSFCPCALSLLVNYAALRLRMRSISASSQ